MKKIILSIIIFLLSCFTLSLFFPLWADKISFCLSGFLASCIISFLFYKLCLVPKIDDFNRRQANLFYYLSLTESNMLLESKQRVKLHQVVKENGKKILLPVRTAKSEYNKIYTIRLDLEKSIFIVKDLNEANNLQIDSIYFNTCEELVNFLWHN